MTAIAPNNANPDLEALLTRVKEQVEDCELKEVILVDDKLVVELTHVQWIRAVTKLQTEDAATYAKLQTLYQIEGIDNVEELPSEEIWDSAQALVKGSASEEVTSIINEEHFKEPALDNLVSLLREIGLKPVCHTGVSDAVPIRTGKLYFLDYRMEDNDATAGLHASSLLKELVDKPGQTPPSAVLMSRGVHDHPTQPEWEKVARDAGYYRFNFRYLDKVKVEKGKMAFLFFIHELLISYPVGQKYYAQLKGLQKAAQDASTNALAEIRALSPAEFRLFAGKYLGDDSGRKASRHILELFLGLLDAQVKENASLESSFRGFGTILATNPVLATTDPDIHTLHRLHFRLMYDRSPWARFGPVEFGDIFYRFGERDAYYLVITPECDLDPRNDDGEWAPKAEKIMLLKGKVKERPPLKEDGDVVGVLFVSDGAPRWIWWGLRDHMLVPAGNLVQKRQEQVTGWPSLIGDTGLPVFGSHDERFLKWGRLRKTEAEHVQQEYVGDIASVGLDDMSGKIEMFSAELWHRQDKQPDRFLGTVTIVETVNQKDKDSPFWAIAAGCEPLLCADGPADVMLPFETVIEMRRPMSKKDFLANCTQKKLHYREAKGGPRRFVWSLKSVPGDWTPKPALDTGQVPAASPQSEDKPYADGQPDQSEPPAAGRPPATPPGDESKIASVIDLADAGPSLPTDKKE